MSQEFYQTMANHHSSRAKNFSSNSDGINRYVKCRIDGDGYIYVYLFEDGVHIQTQTLEIPNRWFDNWPSDDTVRRYIHNHARIGSAPIIDLNA